MKQTPIPTERATRSSPTVLLTGASSGFGRLLVPRLLERGYTVAAGVRGGDARLRELFPRELAAPGHAGRLFALDIHLDRADTRAAAREFVTERWGGRLDILINNAGYGLFGALEDFSEAQLRQQLEVNFLGTCLLTRELLPALRAARGRLINVSSVAGLVALPYYGAYCASKFALDAMSESLHYELKPHGVQVAIVEPGAFRTGFMDSKVLSEGAARGGSPYAARTRALDRFTAKHTARQADPRAVVDRILNLCVRRRVPLRSVVGWDARALTFFSKLLPGAWMVALKERAFRAVVFRD